MNIIDNFRVNSPIPLDKRFQVNSLSEIVYPYEGLITYQLSDSSFYKYQKSTWVKIDLDAQIASVLSSASELSARISALSFPSTEEFENLSNSVTSLQSSLSSIKTALEARIAALESISTNNQTVSDIKSKFETTTSTIQEEISVINSQLSTLDSLKAEVAAFQSSIDSLTSSVSNEYSTLSSSLDEIKKSYVKIAQLESIKTDVSSNILRLQQQIQQNAQNVSDFRTALKQKEDELATSLDALQKSFDSFKTSTTSSISLLDTKTEQLQTQIQQVQNNAQSKIIIQDIDKFFFKNLNPAKVSYTNFDQGDNVPSYLVVDERLYKDNLFKNELDTILGINSHIPCIVEKGYFQPFKIGVSFIQSSQQLSPTSISFDSTDIQVQSTVSKDIVISSVGKHILKSHFEGPGLYRVKLFGDSQTSLDISTVFNVLEVPAITIGYINKSSGNRTILYKILSDTIPNIAVPLTIPEGCNLEISIPVFNQDIETAFLLNGSMLEKSGFTLEDLDYPVYKEASKYKTHHYVFNYTGEFTNVFFQIFNLSNPITTNFMQASQMTATQSYEQLSKVVSEQASKLLEAQTTISSLTSRLAEVEKKLH